MAKPATTTSTEMCQTFLFCVFVFSVVFIPPFNFSLFLNIFFSLSARLTLSYFLILTIPPPLASHAQLPIKIHFFHFSPDSDIPNGFLCFPISSVSFSHPSSTHWHVFFYYPLLHICAIYSIFFLPLQVLGFTDHVR